MKGAAKLGIYKSVTTTNFYKVFVSFTKKINETLKLKEHINIFIGMEFFQAPV